MSLLRPFLEARTLLAVPADADAAAIKRAYRKLTLAHPPDSDPAGFRRVRDAYELLTEPWSRAREMLVDPRPTVDPPPVPPPLEAPSPGELPLALLRLAAAHIDAGSLLEAAAGALVAVPAAAPTERKPAR